jgi:thioredoxin-related protein
MKRLVEKVELAANVAIIAVAILLGAVLVKSYLLPKATQDSTQNSSARETKKGHSVNLADINWQKNGKTLLLTLSATCHFCTESAPFYRRLVKDSGVRLIAVMPQTVVEGRAYLDRLGVPIGDVRQMPLDSIGVAGTPTLLLVDEEGYVSGEWVGRLSPEKETEVLNQVRASK